MPLIKSLAFGSSVPEIAPEDLVNFGLVRLSTEAEDQITNLAEESAALQAQADILENRLAEEAEQISNGFIGAKP